MPCAGCLLSCKADDCHRTTIASTFGELLAYPPILAANETASPLNCKWIFKEPQLKDPAIFVVRWVVVRYYKSEDTVTLPDGKGFCHRNGCFSNVL